MMQNNLVHALHDTGGFLMLPKAYVPLLGVHATMLLTHLNSTIDNGFQTTQDENGIIWHRQNVAWMCRQAALSDHELRKAKTFLLDLGLIYVKQLNGADRTTCWRVNKEKLTRFAAFAYALFSATRPDNSNTIKQWWAFAKTNPDIVEEFRDLYPDVHHFDPPADDDILNKEVRIKAEAEIASMRRTKQGKCVIDIRNNKHFQPALPKKEEAPAFKPCRFVEHWNAQPDIPKCNPGTKGYETMRAFFKAHQRYMAGNCSAFMLDPDEQKRIELAKINRIPVDADRRGRNKIPMRSDKQMFDHIERAAKSYQKEYAPADKTKLPKNAPAFVFNSFSKKYGRSSIFLERLSICPPVLLDDQTREALWNKADKFERMTYQILKYLFDYANNQDENSQLSNRDHKTALRIATSYYDFYWQEMQDTYSDVFASFPHYEDFLSWVGHVGQELVWDNMPMSAFDVGKDFWRKFLQSIGYRSMYHGIELGDLF